MKFSLTFYFLTATTMLSFLFSYFYGLTFDNPQEYIALVSVVLVDGFFGVWAGVRREGFKTYKAIKIIKTLVFWVVLLTTVLAIENAYECVDWLSSTVLPPFLVFQVMSIIKNAHMAGFINNELVAGLLKNIDTHKESRK